MTIGFIVALVSSYALYELSFGNKSFMYLLINYRVVEVLSCRKHELLRGTTSNKEDTIARLDGINPSGGTDPQTGLEVV